LEVSERALVFDLPVMVVAAALCWPLFLTGRVVSRWEGWLLLGGYLGYTAWLMVRAGLFGH
jgi:cation:H+ antiporter